MGNERLDSKVKYRSAGDDSDYSDIQRILERGRSGELNAGDMAAFRSFMNRVTDPELLNTLLADAFESPDLMETIFDAVSDDPGQWPSSTLTRLTECLQFNGLDRSADVIASELRRRHPGNREVIRLWALSAGTPEATVRRFLSALRGADDRAVVIADAREFARRNVDGELMSILESGIASHPDSS